MADFAAGEHGVDKLATEAAGGVSGKCEVTERALLAGLVTEILPDTANLAQRQWHHPRSRHSSFRVVAFLFLLLVVVLLGLAL